jgi:hypothetical protein
MKLSPSEFASVLRKAHIYLHIENLRALFKLLGFEYMGGHSCTFIELIKGCKAFLDGTNLIRDEDLKEKCKFIFNI